LQEASVKFIGVAAEIRNEMSANLYGAARRHMSEDGTVCLCCFPDPQKMPQIKKETKNCD
jgi:hypothetical protein